MSRPSDVFADYGRTQMDAALALISAGYPPQDVIEVLTIDGHATRLPARPAAPYGRCSYCQAAVDPDRERCRTCGAPSSP